MTERGTRGAEALRLLFDRSGRHCRWQAICGATAGALLAHREWAVVGRVAGRRWTARARPPAAGALHEILGAETVARLQSTRKRWNLDDWLAPRKSSPGTRLYSSDGRNCV